MISGALNVHVLHTPHRALQGVPCRPDRAARTTENPLTHKLGETYLKIIRPCNPLQSGTYIICTVYYAPSRYVASGGTTARHQPKVLNTMHRPQLGQ